MQFLLCAHIRTSTYSTMIGSTGISDVQMNSLSSRLSINVHSSYSIFVALNKLSSATELYPNKSLTAIYPGEQPWWIQPYLSIIEKL